jgi:OFA family oxalate/formate antiporter-like MFS transporter
MMRIIRQVAESRWSVVAGGFLIALMGGLSYSWGVFVEPMKAQFGWSKMVSTIPLSIFMGVFAIVMIPAGRLQERIGLKRQIRIAALLFLLAYLMSSMVVYFPFKWWLILSYGVVGGIACGLSYSCVAPPIRRWFPDHPGLAVSLGVMGFGLAAFFFAPFKARIAIPHLGLQGTFILIGIITSVITYSSSWLVKLPSDTWHLHLFGAMHLTGNDSMIMANIGPGEMLRRRLFWLTWAAYLMVIYGSLLIIGILPSYGQTVVKLTPGQAAIPISLYSLTNGISRPLAGFVSDRIGTLKWMSGVYLIQALVFFLFPFYVYSLAAMNAAALILGLGIATSLALFPVLTSEFFGVEHLGINYGILFSAYGFGALAIQGGAMMHDLTGSYTPALLLAGAMSALGCGLILYIRRHYKLS